MIYDVKDDPILQVSSQEPSTSSKSPSCTFFSQIMSDLDQTFKIGPLATNDFIFYFQLDDDVKDDPILQVSSQEHSTSSKSKI